MSWFNTDFLNPLAPRSSFAVKEVLFFLWYSSISFMNFLMCGFVVSELFLLSFA